MIKVMTPYGGKFNVKNPKKIKWWKKLASNPYHSRIIIKEV